MATAAGRSAEDTMIYIWGCFQKFIIPTADGFLGTIDIFFQLRGEVASQGLAGQEDPRGTPEARKAGSKLCDGYCGVLVPSGLRFQGGLGMLNLVGCVEQPTKGPAPG